MATRPLDAAFGGSTTKKSKKRGAILAVGIVAGLASIGSIFAASITINSPATNPGISYSQATTTIAACDEDILASIGAYYDTTEGAFSADQITLSDVSDSCDSQTLTLELYNGSTKLVTFVGDIDSGAGTELVIGSADSILTGGVGGAMNGTTTGFSGTPTIVYAGVNDSYDVASSATRIVIEIN
jgi:hypothetical protein